MGERGSRMARGKGEMGKNGSGKGEKEGKGDEGK